jgi:hypothetical protein
LNEAVALAQEQNGRDMIWDEPVANDLKQQLDLNGPACPSNKQTQSDGERSAQAGPEKGERGGGLQDSHEESERMRDDACEVEICDR